MLILIYECNEEQIGRTNDTFIEKLSRILQLGNCDDGTQYRETGDYLTCLRYNMFDYT